MQRDRVHSDDGKLRAQWAQPRRRRIASWLEGCESGFGAPARAGRWCSFTAACATAGVERPDRRAQRRVHCGGVGRTRLRPLIGPARHLPLGRVRGLPGRFIEALELTRPHLLGHSFGAGLALELYRRRPHIPRSLVLAGAYAGWAGSLRAEEVEQRLRLALETAELLPDRFLPQSIPGLFSDLTPPDRAEELATIMAEARPVGTRVMAHALAEADLRDVLPKIQVPTLLLCGEADRRSPLRVAHALHAAIPTSRMIVLPGLGHESYLESPQQFNAEVRAFLQTVA